MESTHRELVKDEPAYEAHIRVLRMALGAEAVVFGPGDIKVAHQTGEYVPIEDLVRCEAVLARAIAHFCGGSAG